MVQEDIRSDQQRKAIEVWCRLVSDALNDAGYEMKAVFEVMEVDIPWSQERVKDLLWRKIQLVMTEIESTTKINTTEVRKVHEVLDRHLAINFGIHIPFPSYL